ncbi:hypothetical protein HDV03_003027 [Kappamyces sp. JEL0829]|nr:hypothetical protein HDV03_003027 [Kappamyces sp. JEL0829]
MHYSSVDENPNTNWLHTRGSWIVVLFFIFIVRLAVSGIPGITVELSWTITNLLYNVTTFIWFHIIIGTPFSVFSGFSSFSSNEYEGLTMWEQIDNGQQFTPTKKFLTGLPIVLFLLSTHYSHYDLPTFLVNFSTLLLVLVAKLPVMHKVRIFGINEKHYYED